MKLIDYMGRRVLLRQTLLAFLACCLTGHTWGRDRAAAIAHGEAGKALNVVLLTLDDMGWRTAGVEGCTVPGVTPHIDRLASQGKRFTHGYVMVPMCGPSRAALLTGRYPHTSGMMGHGKQPPDSWEEPTVKTPSLTAYLHQQGYRTGAILKNSRTAFLNVWDVSYNERPVGAGFHDRNPDSFYQRSKAFFAEAAALGQPFFLYANPIDPHDPWPGTEWERKALEQYNPGKPYPEPGRRYTPGDVDVPACLPDLPAVRKKLVPYYEAMHRGDACIGAILQAIEDSGQADNTLVIFLSDNGMGIPGAKNTLYQHGTRTPIIMKLPGVIAPGEVDDRSIVSAIDIMPTILEACGLPPIKSIEGRSIYDVLVGDKEQADRSYALTTFDYWGDSEEAQFFPQRSIINGEFCYIWNAYVQRSKGKKVMPMFWNDVLLDDSGENPIVAERIAYYKARPVEEFYDLSKDPGCWNNLAGQKDYQQEFARFRAILKQEMKQSNDPERFVYHPELITN